MVKVYQDEGIYHLYNRGVDRREVFGDEQDYATFLWNLEQYLAPYDPVPKPGFKADHPRIQRHKREMSLYGQVELLAYCLMPNHFHLMVRQHVPDGIVKLMRRVCTNYSMYFNKKYGRQGSLWETIYKGVVVEGEGQMIALARYIHLNPVSKSMRKFGPVETTVGSRPEEYPYSSFKYYLSGKNLTWLDVSQVPGVVDKNERELEEELRLD